MYFVYNLNMMKKARTFAKKTFGVWHLNNTRDAGWAETPAAWPVGYTKVAQLEGADLDEVFRLTNSIDSPWFEAAGITRVRAGSRGLRSSSVGDVFEVDGVGHRVAAMGFEVVKGHPGIVGGSIV